MSFEILTPEPIEMRVGTLIDYRLKFCGWPVKWRTRIERFDPANDSTRHNRLLTGSLAAHTAAGNICMGFET